jgi:ABC-2 type transport system permease protein
MRNIVLVAKREYLEQIKGRAFRLTTILLPAVFAIVIGIGYISTIGLGSGKHLAIASNDVALANEISNRLLHDKDDSKEPEKANDSKTKVDVVAPVSQPQLDALRDQVRKKDIDGVLWVQINPGAAPKATYTSRSSGDFVSTGRLHRAMNHALVSRNLTGAGMQQSQADTLVRGVDIDTFQMKKDGRVLPSSAQASFWKGYVMAFLLSMTTMIYGLNVARSIIQEKTSRIFEVMLSIAEPADLLAGKLIGVGAVGLTQILIWVVSAGLLAATPFVATLLTGDFAIQLSWTEGILFPVYFVLGYFLFSALFAGLAATCETEQELQMYTPLAAAPVWLSFAMILLIMNDSNSVWSIAASLFPPCAPIVMFLRMGSEIPPTWQFVASISLMIVSIIAVLWFSAKLYRIGILMYGKRATLPEIFRWIRYS